MNVEKRRAVVQLYAKRSKKNTFGHSTRSRRRAPRLGFGATCASELRRIAPRLLPRLRGALASASAVCFPWPLYARCPQTAAAWADGGARLAVSMPVVADHVASARFLERCDRQKRTQRTREGAGSGHGRGKAADGEGESRGRRGERQKRTAQAVDGDGTGRGRIGGRQRTQRAREGAGRRRGRGKAEDTGGRRQRTETAQRTAQWMQRTETAQRTEPAQAEDAAEEPEDKDEKPKSKLKQRTTKRTRRSKVYEDKRHGANESTEGTRRTCRR